METNNYLVYLISHPDSNYFYVGKTDNIKQRISKHLSDSRVRPTTFIHNWLQKYPEPMFEVLEENIDEQTAFLYERMYISLFKSWNILIMNLTNGGEGSSGYKHTDETKLLISKIHKGQIYSNESRKMMSDKKKGENHFMFGKHFSDEHKKNASISHTKIDRAVNVYSKDGVFIKQYENSAIANRTMFPELKMSTGEILANCRGIRYFYENHIFQFTDDDHVLEILEKYKLSPAHKQQAVQQYTVSDEFVEEFENSYKAEKILNLQGLNIRSGDIRSCCKGKQKTCRGFKFRYKEYDGKEIR